MEAELQFVDWGDLSGRVIQVQQITLSSSGTAKRLLLASGHDVQDAVNRYFAEMFDEEIEVVKVLCDAESAASTSSVVATIREAETKADTIEDSTGIAAEEWNDQQNDVTVLSGERNSVGKDQDRMSEEQVKFCGQVLKELMESKRDSASQVRTDFQYFCRL